VDSLRTKIKKEEEKLNAIEKDVQPDVDGGDTDTIGLKAGRNELVSEWEATVPQFCKRPEEGESGILK